MHPTLHLLLTRRSPKPTSLRPPGPTASELDTILTIASRVPDHGKLVPWRFIVIEGDRRLALGDVIAEAFIAKNPSADAAPREDARTRLAKAPLVIAVVAITRRDPADPTRPHPKIPEIEQTLSAGAACMNLVIAANALGYGAVWLSEWYAFDPRVTGAMGLKVNERIAGFIHIGTPSEVREDRERPQLSEIVTRY